MSRDDNIIPDETKSVVTPTESVFRFGKTLKPKWRIFAVYDEAQLEIYVGNETDYSILRARLSDAELSTASSGLYVSGSCLRIHINRTTKESLAMNVTPIPGDTIKYQLSIHNIDMDRSFNIPLTTTEVTLEHRYKCLFAEFEEYKLKMVKIIDGYKKQLDSKAKALIAATTRKDPNDLSMFSSFDDFDPH